MPDEANDFTITVTSSELKKTLEKTGPISVGSLRVVCSQGVELELTIPHTVIVNKQLVELVEELVGRYRKCLWSMKSVVTLSKEEVDDLLSTLRSTGSTETLTGS